MAPFDQFDNASLALKTLAENDDVLRKYISNDLEKQKLLPTKKENYMAFSKLIKVIISQQLSGTAADKIYSRFCNTFNLGTYFQAEHLNGLSQLQIRKCGISNAKATFILSLREKIIIENDFFQKIEMYSDSELELALIEIKGIGKWTAKILMMSHYGRIDIFPESDGTLIKAIGLMNYNVKDIISISEKWKPYRSIASRIIWNSYDLGLLK